MIEKASRIQELWWRLSQFTKDELRAAAVKLADNISGCNHRHCTHCAIAKSAEKIPPERERRFDDQL